MLVTGTSNERRPTLPAEARTALRARSLAGDAASPAVTVTGVDGDAARGRR